MVKRRRLDSRRGYKQYYASIGVFSPLIKAITFSFIALVLLVIFLRVSPSLDRDHVLVFETEEQDQYSFTYVFFNCILRIYQEGVHLPYRIDSKHRIRHF